MCNDCSAGIYPEIPACSELDFSALKEEVIQHAVGCRQLYKEIVLGIIEILQSLQ